MKTKIYLSTLIFLSISGLLLLSPLIAWGQPVNCCKLGGDLKIYVGKVYSGTVYYNDAGSYRTCTDAAPCDCADRSTSAFPTGCRLRGGNTIGGTETGVICSQANYAGTKDQVPDNEIPGWGMTCILNSVNTITNWIFVILVAVTALITIAGGFMISTAGGDANKVNTGRNYILYAMVGFALALLSRAIPSVTRALLGV